MMRPGVYRWVLLALAWVVGVDLRTSLIGVAPVLSLLQRNWGLSYASGGMVFALPIALMGATSLGGGWLSDHWGAKRTILLGLALVALGAGLRGWSQAYSTFLVWTAVLGVGIGTAQPCLPRLVKEWFTDRPGFATGICTAGLMAGAFFGVSLTPGLAALAGWRGTFWVWGGICAATLLVWAAVARDRTMPQAGPRPAVIAFRIRRPLALAGLLFFLQGVAFYTADAWLPQLYQGLGWSLAASAAPLSAFELAMLVTGLTVPTLSDRVGLRRPFLLASSAAFALLCAGLVAAPLLLPVAFGALLGASYGAFFALCMVLPVDLARIEHAGTSTGFVFALGYVGAMLGPVLSGTLRDWTGWVAAGGLPALAAAVVFFGISLALPETGTAGLGTSAESSTA